MRGRLVEDRIEERICKIRVIDGVIANYYPQEELIRCKDCALWNDADSEHLVGYCTEGDGEKITFRNEWCCWAERKEE